MPGDYEIILKCPECGMTTRYVDVYQHGQLRTNHKMGCTAQHDPYPKMTLTQVTKPSE